MAYVNDSNIRIKCKILAALAFVPVDKVVDTFEELQANIPEALQELYDYFEDTWIGRLRHNNRSSPPFFHLRFGLCTLYSQGHI